MQFRYPMARKLYRYTSFVHGEGGRPPYKAASVLTATVLHGFVGQGRMPTERSGPRHVWRLRSNTLLNVRQTSCHAAAMIRNISVRNFFISRKIRYTLTAWTTLHLGSLCRGVSVIGTQLLCLCGGTDAAEGRPYGVT